MEITRELLESLSSEDMECMKVFNRLLAEAKANVKVIHDAYRFKIGEDKIIIWENEHNAEYLTQGGVWQARYLHQTYDLPVTVDAVFDAYKANYEHKKHPTGRVNNLADSADYFRSFVKKTSEALDGGGEDG